MYFIIFLTVAKVTKSKQKKQHSWWNVAFLNKIVKNLANTK